MARSISLRSFIASERAGRLPAPLAPSGRFDLSAIMREAVKVARSIRRDFGSWQTRMQIALRTVWKRAKVAKVEASLRIRGAANGKPLPISADRQRMPHRAEFGHRLTAFVIGSRATSHGW